MGKYFFFYFNSQLENAALFDEYDILKNCERLLFFLFYMIDSLAEKQLMSIWYPYNRTWDAHLQQDYHVLR